jgi:hypothetical protein
LYGDKEAERQGFTEANERTEDQSETEEEKPPELFTEVNEVNEGEKGRILSFTEAFTPRGCL